jgi:hypothetical protein
LQQPTISTFRDHLLPITKLAYVGQEVRISDFGVLERRAKILSINMHPQGYMQIKFTGKCAFWHGQDIWLGFLPEIDKWMRISGPWRIFDEPAPRKLGDRAALYSISPLS